MFFLIITANLAVYLSSLQLLGAGSTALGSFALAGGAVMTALSAVYYWIRQQFSSHSHHQGPHDSKVGMVKKLKKVKKINKLLPDCDCLDCDCPDCGCDC